MHFDRHVFMSMINPVKPEILAGKVPQRYSIVATTSLPGGIGSVFIPPFVDTRGLAQD